MVSEPKRDKLQRSDAPEPLRPQAQSPSWSNSGPTWASGRAMLTLPEVAAACGVSAKTVRRWIANGALPCVRLPGAGSRPMTLLRPSDLQAWINTSTVQAEVTPSEQRTVALQGRRFIHDRRKAKRV